jgi:hypothetical protein
MRYEDAETFPGLIMWSGSTRGPRAVPGLYQARLIVDGDSLTVPFEIKQDPRSSSALADLQAQFDFLIDIRDRLSETHKAIKQIRDVRDQAKAITDRLGDHDGADEIKEAAKALNEQLTAIEETLYQTKNRSGQDPLNFPIRLNDKLAGVASTASQGDYRPTDQAVSVRDELSVRIDAELAHLDQVLGTELPAFNALVREKAVPAVLLKPEDKPTVVSPSGL